MDETPDLEARVTAVEARVEYAVADAAAARHLAAAVERDLSAVVVKLDANREATNALGIQTAGRFDEVNRRLDALTVGQQNLAAGQQNLAAGQENLAVGQQHLVRLLTLLIDREGDPGDP